MEQTLFVKNSIAKHEFTEITIPAASSQVRFQFPDIQNIRNTKLKGIQVYTDAEVKKSILTGNILPPPKLLAICYLTLLTYDGREVIKQLPIINTNTNGGFGVSNVSNLGFSQLKNLRINYPKSFIEFTEVVSDPVEDLAICFSIYYEDLTREEMQQGDTFKNRS